MSPPANKPVIPAQSLPSTPDNEYTYDTLDRLTRAEYLVAVQTQNEGFVYDKLGNRTTLKHNGTDVARYQHNDVNEYTYIGLASGTNLTHDDAGNMTGDHDGYTYHYDYENRLTRVKKSSDTLDVAVYTYDALGRRIAVEDCIADTTTHYYYDGWRVLSETDDNDDWSRDYDYGNYIDEVLVMTDASDDHYFAHDHLFSVVALIDEDGDILERYEYDAYGKCHFYDSSFTLLGTQKSGHGNDRLFTSQVLDILDGGALSLEYFKNRYKKDSRFITRDPLGVRDGICIIEFTPTGSPIFPRANNAKKQYHDGMSLYEYVNSSPVMNTDIYGLMKKCSLSLYTARGGDDSFFSQSVRKKIAAAGNFWWAFTFNTFDNNFGLLRKRLKQQGCCCYSSVSTYDHGVFTGIDENEEPIVLPGFGGGNPGQPEQMETADIRKLCPLLCESTTLYVFSCQVGSTNRARLQYIFDACDKIKRIRACKGDVWYTPSGIVYCRTPAINIDR